MVILWLGIAWAGAVQCEPDAARNLLKEARIPERRVPFVYPELLPGLARSSAAADPDLVAVLDDLCTSGEGLSLVSGDRWEELGWSAHTARLRHTETEGCSLVHQGLVLSVGIPLDGAPLYTMVERWTPTRTPVADCPVVPSWLEERVLGGAGGPVRVVLAIRRDEQRVLETAVNVRWATPTGWRQEVLLSPAPLDLLDPSNEPVMMLLEQGSESWIVARAQRPHPCSQQGRGPVVWTRQEDVWHRHESQPALTMLTEQGLWKLTDQEGWLVILAQGDEGDEELLRVRSHRLERRAQQKLLVTPSAWFPGLNPGFLVITPPPFATQEDAQTAQKQLPKRQRSYVKRAWQGPTCP